MNNLLRAVVPGAAVLITAVVVLVAFPADVARIVEDYALVAYGAGLALAWVFRRSRAFVALGLLIWLDVAVVGETVSRDLLTALGTVVVALVGLLGVLRDRGIASRWGVA